jgi:hypothetical protein
MSPVKEALRETIERLSDEDAARLLEVARRLFPAGTGSRTLQRLAEDPAFRLPADRSRGFRPVEPIHCRGIDASRIIEESRR